MHVTQLFESRLKTYISLIMYKHFNNKKIIQIHKIAFHNTPKLITGPKD